MIVSLTVLFRLNALVRSYVDWPNMGKQLKDFADNCTKCHLATKCPRNSFLGLSWILLGHHIDFERLIDGKYFLLPMDFTSAKFSDFCQQPNDIKDIRTPQFHSQLNGKVERLVDNF